MLGNNYDTMKMHWQLLKIYYSEPLAQFQTNLEQSIIESNEGPCPVPMGDNTDF